MYKENFVKPCAISLFVCSVCHRCYPTRTVVGEAERRVAVVFAVGGGGG